MASDIAVIEERARRAVEYLSGQAHVVAAYLFGSHIQGRADEYSDIDIGAFIQGIEQWDWEKLLEINWVVQKTQGFDIEMHFFNSRNLPDPDPASFAAYVIKNGRRIFTEQENQRTNRE